MRVDQVIPSFASRDAIGVHTMAITEALRSVGIESEIFYGECPTPFIADRARPIAELGRNTRDRWLLYQSSIGSHIFDIVAARDEPKLVNYHNITPATLLEGWEPRVGHQLKLGRAQLRRMAKDSQLAIADSHYNELELIESGYAETEVVPLLIDMTSAGGPPDTATVRQLEEEKAAGGVDLLFVGKVAPHKAPHDLIKMLAVFRQLYDPRARLHLVGGALGVHYGPAVEAFIERLELGDAVRITGPVSESVLEAYYRCADVFVCASDHEGFCVPLVEAMGHGVPVVAYASTAVPETASGAGLLLPSKEPLRFAAAVARVLEDATLRAALSNAGRERAAHFSLERSRIRMVDAILKAIKG